MINSNLSCAKIDEKNIYNINQHPNLLMKKTTQKELNNHYKALEILQNQNIPNIVFTMSIDKNVYIVMEKINGMSISDMYGENPLDVPANIFTQIRQILQNLKDNNLDYIDITGYNFMIDQDENVYIIDFEHCIDRSIDTNINDGKSCYLNIFLSGINDWDPEFA